MRQSTFIISLRDVYNNEILIQLNTRFVSVIVIIIVDEVIEMFIVKRR